MKSRNKPSQPRPQTHRPESPGLKHGSPAESFLGLGFDFGFRVNLGFRVRCWVSEFGCK